MTRVLYAVILGGLALLIPVAVGQFWSDTDPSPPDSESAEAEPAGDPVTAEQSPPATDPPGADSESSEAEPADDSVPSHEPDGLLPVF